MTTATLSAVELKCSKCGVARSFWPSSANQCATAEDCARVQGWRVYDGPSATGKPLSLRYCPVCAGNASDELAQELHGWDAECDTCHAVMSEDWDDEKEEGEVFTEKDARAWRMDHQCEPEVSIIRPKGMTG